MCSACGYYNGRQVIVNDVETGTAQDIDTTDAMKSYMSAISRNKARAE